MTIVGEYTQIVNVRFDQVCFARAPHDTVIEGAAEEFREDGNDVESHWGLSYRNTHCAGHRWSYFVHVNRLCQSGLREVSLRCAARPDPHARKYPAPAESVFRHYLQHLARHPTQPPTMAFP